MNNERPYYERVGNRYYRVYPESSAGIDGIMGVEYKIPSIPFAVSVDIKPFMDFYRYGGVYTTIDPGLGIKVIF